MKLFRTYIVVTLVLLIALSATGIYQSQHIGCDSQSSRQTSIYQATKSPAPPAKTQEKENEQNFDVLFVYTLVKSWFGTSEQEDGTQNSSPGLFVIEAITLLLQQFKG